MAVSCLSCHGDSQPNQPQVLTYSACWTYYVSLADKDRVNGMFSVRFLLEIV